MNSLTRIQKACALFLMSLMFVGIAHGQSAPHSHAALDSDGFRPGSVVNEMNLEFELLNGAGELVQSSDFRGKNLLVAFGFTYCPDVCPVIAANMANALRQSDKDAVGVFISVDTERDTPAITDDYASRFGEGMIGLGGSHQQVSEAAKNFNVTFVVTKTPDSYTVQHSPGTFLISPQGELIEVFAINADPKEIAAAMK